MKRTAAEEAPRRHIKRVKCMQVPSEIQALPHVMERIEEFAMSYEDAAIKAAATGQIEWLETLRPHFSNYVTIIEVGAAHGHCDVIEAAYDWGNLDSSDLNLSLTALTNAIKGGYVDAVQLLLPNYSSNFLGLWDALDEALETKHQVMIDVVAEAFCENCDDEDSKDVFCWAAEEGVIQVVKGLCHGQFEFTAFEAMTIAAGKGYFDIVKYLLRHAEFGGDDMGDSPIVYAASNGHLNIVEFLFDNWENEKTQLDKAFTEAASGGHMEVVKFFLENEVNQPSLLKDAYCHAARCGRLEMMIFLYSCECEPSQEDALKQAATSGQLKIVEFLFNNGVNQMTLPNDAFVQAATGGHLKVVEFLFNNGVNQMTLLEDAFMQAATGGHLKVVEFLFSNGANQATLLNDAFTKTVAGKHLQVMKFLYDIGGRPVGSLGGIAKIHAEIMNLISCKEEDTPALLNAALKKAATRGDLNVIKFLIAYEVKTDGAFLNAISCCCLEVVKFLFDKGVSVSLRNHAFKVAADKGYLKIVELLFGDEISQSTFDDAFVNAATNARFDILRFYFQKQNIQATALEDALMAAVAKGHFQVVEVLLERGGKIRQSVREEAFIMAVTADHVGISKILLNYAGCRNTSLVAKAFAITATHSRMKLMKFLFEKGVSQSLINDAFVTATVKSDYEKMKFLVKNSNVEASLIDDAFVKVASEGRIGMVKLMYSKRAAQPSRIKAIAITSAAANGHLNVAKFLFTKGVESSARGDAFINAASGGYLEIAKLLHTKERLSEAITVAAANDHLNVVEFLNDRKSKDS